MGVGVYVGVDVSLGSGVADTVAVESTVSVGEGVNVVVRVSVPVGIGGSVIVVVIGGSVDIGAAAGLHAVSISKIRNNNMGYLMKYAIESDYNLKDITGL
jgi:hypothetical protein